ncbi:MAG TPA: plasmid pRiA4b ORF-3 family protein [Holophaga sp.]|nr:plasmid pRiA4b ORF-3 family protein [Holophaga sp.]
MSAAGTREAFQIKIVLAETDPPVWRRLQVPVGLSLARLHRAIQAAFGWEDEHAHLFRVHGREYGPRSADPALALKAETTTLASLRVAVGDVFAYEYGLEEAWTHLLTVEERLRPGTPLEGPVCVAGRMACPPEGSGGPYAFRERLAAAEDPSHPEHGQARAFFPAGWESSRFDRESANAALRTARG